MQPPLSPPITPPSATAQPARPIVEESAAAKIEDAVLSPEDQAVFDSIISSKYKFYYKTTIGFSSIKVIEKLKSSAEFQLGLQQGMESLVSNGHIESLQELLALEFHATETLQRALQNGMESLIYYGHIEKLQELLALELHTPETLQNMQPGLQQGMENLVSNGKIESIQKLLALELHATETLQRTLQNGMEILIFYGHIEKLQELLALEPHTPETLQNIQPDLQKRMESFISNGDIESLQKLLALELHTPETLEKVEKFKFLHNDLKLKDKDKLSRRDYDTYLKPSMQDDKTFSAQLETFDNQADRERHVIEKMQKDLDLVERGSKEERRILNVVVGMDMANGGSVVSKYMSKKDMPDRAWMHFANKLSEGGVNSRYFTPNLGKYIESKSFLDAERNEKFKISESENDKYVSKYMSSQPKIPNNSFGDAFSRALKLDSQGSREENMKFKYKVSVKKDKSQEEIKLSNLKTLRQLLARYPNEFNTVIDTLSSLDITGLEEEFPVIESALRDIGAVTPEIYKGYKNAREGVERMQYVEKIKQLKSKLFGNTNLGDLDVPSDVLREAIYSAYKPTNTSYTGVLEYMNSIPDGLERQMSQYNFPMNGYEVNMSSTEFNLKKGEHVVTDFQNISQMYTKKVEGKEIEKTLRWLCTGASGSTHDQVASVMSLFEDNDKKRLSALLANAKTDNEKVLALNSIVEACGILAKDTLPKKVAELFASSPELLESLTKTLVNEKYAKQLATRIGATDFTSDINYAVSKLLVRSLENVASTAKRDLKKFEASDGGGAADNQNRYKYYISKNKGSFFSKSTSGICTADDIDLFASKDYFHINLVENDNTCLGNVQAYVHPTHDGKKMLVLRGFNPSESALKNISAKSYVEEALRIGREFVKDNNLEGLAIVYDEDWHPLSNREQIRQYFSSVYRGDGNALDIPTLKYNSKGSSTNRVRLMYINENKVENLKKVKGVTKSHDRPHIDGAPTYVEHYQNQKGRLIAGVPTKMLSFKRVPVDNITNKYHNIGIVDYSGGKVDQFAEDYMYVLADDGDVSLPGNAPHWRAVNNEGHKFGYTRKDGTVDYYFDVNTKGCGFIRREMVECNDADSLKGINELGVGINYGLAWGDDFNVFDGNLVSLTKKLTEQGMRTELYWSIADIDAVPFNGKVLTVKEAKEGGVIHKDESTNPNIGVRLLRSNYRLEEFAKCDEDRKGVILAAAFDNFNKETDAAGRDLPVISIENKATHGVYVEETIRQYVKNLALLINNNMTYMYMHQSNLTMLGEIVDMGVVMSLKKTPKEMENYEARFGMYQGVRQGHIKDMTDLCYGMKSFLKSLSGAGVATPSIEDLQGIILEEFKNNLDQNKVTKGDTTQDVSKLIPLFENILDYTFVRGGRLGSMKYGVESLPFSI